MDSQTIYDNVAKRYSNAAHDTDSKHHKHVASAFGYSESDLSGALKEANLGLSCGNPLAIASLREGETVLDLGSGAGFDILLAAKQIGSSGRAIGIDMNKEMLALANKNKQRASATNVEFIESRITKLPVKDNSIDCVISNCVINLVPEQDKQQVFNEACRVLRPGGRLAVSDILTENSLPEHVRNDMALYVGCISGASAREQYENYMQLAGFKDILIVHAEADLNVYQQVQGGDASCCRLPESNFYSLPQGQKHGSEVDPQRGKLDFNELAGSYKIFALKLQE